MATVSHSQIAGGIFYATLTVETPPTGAIVTTNLRGKSLRKFAMTALGLIPLSRTAIMNPGHS